MYLQAEDMTNTINKDRRRQLLQNYLIRYQQDLEREVKSKEGRRLDLPSCHSLLLPVTCMYRFYVRFLAFSTCDFALT